MASSSSSVVQKSFLYDVFLSFGGEDTRRNFVDHLFEALDAKGIRTYKDDVRIRKGRRISPQLIKAIEDSRFYIIVFSKSYASSSWCLQELVKIMECQKMTDHIAYPVFFDVEPTEVRKQSGAVGEAFAKLVKQVKKKRWSFGIASLMNRKKDMLKIWKRALKEGADLTLDGYQAELWKRTLKKAAGQAGLELKNTLDGHEAQLIKKVVKDISLELRSINFGFNDKLVGMETRVKDVFSHLETGIDEVCMLGIKGIRGGGKTALARALFDHPSNDFDAKCFVGNVREVSNASMFGLKKLQEQVLSKVLNEDVTLDSVDDGRNMMKMRMGGIKVLLVLDDVDHIDQLEALASGPKWFKSGSRIIITIGDEQVLANRVNLILGIDLLSKQEATCLLSRYAFGTENPAQGYEELCRKVVRYAAGLPLTITRLGSLLCGNDMNDWEDVIERLKDIPLEDTLKKLELSYIDLEVDYREMFLDIACILKGKYKDEAITILKSCGFHARNGLKVLQQRSLITVDILEHVGMHDHIEEMGKHVVRRKHPDEPNKHTHLWVGEEIEDILANDTVKISLLVIKVEKTNTYSFVHTSDTRFVDNVSGFQGTEETRCLKVDISRGNERIVMKGLGKMKKLRYLEVKFADYDFGENDDECIGTDPNFDHTSQYFPNSLKHLKCWGYPFLYLPKTFQANNLVGLEMERGGMVRLWKEGERKVLKKLKFLSFYQFNLTTFDFSITPNLETLSLAYASNLKELYMPTSCQKLKYLHISYSKLTTFDLGLTPNLEKLSFDICADFKELHVSVACPNLKFLHIYISMLRTLNLELIPNLERLDLQYSKELVEIKVPAGCLKLVKLNLSGCARLEKLPEDLGLSGCLKELDILDTSISHLPESIVGLKGRLVINASSELLQKYGFPSMGTAAYWISRSLQKYKNSISS